MYELIESQLTDGFNTLRSTAPPIEQDVACQECEHEVGRAVNWGNEHSFWTVYLCRDCENAAPRVERMAA